MTLYFFLFVIYNLCTIYVTMLLLCHKERMSCYLKFSIFSLEYFFLLHISFRRLLHFSPSSLFHSMFFLSAFLRHTCATTTSWMWRSSFDHRVKILSQVIWYILIKIYILSFVHVFAWNSSFSTSLRKQWKHSSECKNSNKLQMTPMSTLIEHKAFW
jgi:hypothetical protein